MPGFPDPVPQIFNSLPVGIRNTVTLWWNAFRNYLLANFFTNSDITVTLKGKGLVLTNSAGTVTKRIKLNDAGTDITIENV